MPAKPCACPPGRRADVAGICRLCNRPIPDSEHPGLRKGFRRDDEPPPDRESVTVRPTA